MVLSTPDDGNNKNGHHGNNDGTSCSPHYPLPKRSLLHSFSHHHIDGTVRTEDELLAKPAAWVKEGKPSSGWEDMKHPRIDRRRNKPKGYVSSDLNAQTRRDSHR